MPCHTLLKSFFLSLTTGLLLACQSLPLSHQIGLPPSSLTRFNQAEQNTLTGDFRTHQQVKSKFLDQARDILVYLPPGYQQNPSQRYPVLYMHDGNNIFDRSTSFGGSEWQVDENAQRLIGSGKIQPLIIVGIYNTAARMDEYTWYPMDLDGQIHGGAGKAYGRFLVEELKPLIDNSYRTLPDRENTGLMGSSLGGLISFYLAREYPQIFSKVGMMSPSIWWKDRAILQDVSQLGSELKIWVDIGTQEGRNPQAMLQNTQDFVRMLETQGFQHFKNLAFHIEPGAGHNEAAWAARVERPLQFFFGR